MDERIRRGEELFSRGLLTEARTSFEAVLADSPHDSQAWNDLGVVYLHSGDPSRAESAFCQAVVANPDHLESILNLADFYMVREDWEAAAHGLRRALEFFPENLAVLRRLVRALGALGRREEAGKLIKESRAFQIVRRFIDGLWTAVAYWELAEGLGSRERLIGMLGSTLGALEDLGGPDLHFRLVADNPPDATLVLEELSEFLYYQRAEPASLENIRENKGRVLEIGPHPDWEMFRPLLFQEIKYEGGCLADFTHTRKIMRRETNLRQYDLEATLDYFRRHVGHCDCHVFRGSWRHGDGAEFYEHPESPVPPTEKAMGSQICPLATRVPPPQWKAGAKPVDH